MGYGAMQPAGPGVWGPPKDVNTAIAVLREAVELGISIPPPDMASIATRRRNATTKPPRIWPGSGRSMGSTDTYAADLQLQLPLPGAPEPDSSACSSAYACVAGFALKMPLKLSRY